MSAGPLVSIIILAYKQPEFLNQLFACIGRQTYTNIEIVVVDDASGPEFVSRYQLPAQARLLVNEKNVGLAAISRNRALRETTGPYVAFTDQDDLWEPEKLALQVAALEAQPAAAMHYTHMRLADSHGKSIDEQEAFKPLGADSLPSLIRRNSIAYSSTMVRRSALDSLGLFDESIRGAADWDMWLRLAACGPVLEDPRPLTVRRMHGAQWSKSVHMLARGGEAVLAKAAQWVPEKRPDLRGLVNRRYARQLRRLAQRDLNAGEGSDVLEKLRRAAHLFPWDFRTYGLMIRAAMVGGGRSTSSAASIPKR